MTIKLGSTDQLGLGKSRKLPPRRIGTENPIQNLKMPPRRIGT